MYNYNKDDPAKIRQEHSGTKCDLWINSASGALTCQVIEHEEGKSPSLVRLDSFYLLVEFFLALGFSEELMPYSYALSKHVNQYKLPLTSNVHAIINHNRWPLTVADLMTERAQIMVGYFTGHPVTVDQMGALRVTEQGEIDRTVEQADVNWTEPFELADDCLFCERMTDQTVVDRVAGFQWALDKEVAGRFGAGLAEGSGTLNVPKHYDFADTDEGRRAYHDILKPWYAEHPMLLKVIPLIDLPLHLKRTLCIQWNHIVRDYLKLDPRFVYHEATDMYYWMNVDANIDDTTKKLIPQVKTRSNPSGSTDIDLTMYNPFLGGNYGPF